MQKSVTAHSPERVAVLRWTASMGAVTAEALAHREALTVASARARLRAASRARLLTRSRPLAQAPALYSVTRAGMRVAGVHGLDPCTITAAGAAHQISCAAAAAALERAYPGHRVIGERELRRDEREHARALASAPVGAGPWGEQRLHRPDLVLWPQGSPAGLPVAVEVELTVKAPRRLASICRAWARARGLAGVLYLTSPEVQPALERAVLAADAQERIAVVPFAALALALPAAA